jgi:hypothetical protein
VGHEDAGTAGVGTDPAQVLLEPFAGQCVQRREGLVEQQQRIRHGERPGDGHPLLLTAGDLPGAPVGDVVQPHPGQQLGDPFAAVGDARVAQRQLDVAADSAPREQPRLLEDHAGAAAGHRCGATGADRTAGRLLKTRDEPQQRALAAAGRAHQHEELPRRHGQAHRPHRRDVTVGVLHAVELDGGLSRGHRAGP